MLQVDGLLTMVFLRFLRETYQSFIVANRARPTERTMMTFTWHRLPVACHRGRLHHYFRRHSLLLSHNRKYWCDSDESHSARKETYGIPPGGWCEFSSCFWRRNFSFRYFLFIRWWPVCCLRVLSCSTYRVSFCASCFAIGQLVDYRYVENRISGLPPGGLRWMRPVFVVNWAFGFHPDSNIGRFSLTFPARRLLLLASSIWSMNKHRQPDFFINRTLVVDAALLPYSASLFSFAEMRRLCITIKASYWSFVCWVDSFRQSLIVVVHHATTFQSRLYLNCIFTCSSLSKEMSLLLFYAFLFCSTIPGLHVCSFSTKFNSVTSHVWAKKNIKTSNDKRKNISNIQLSRLKVFPPFSVGIACLISRGWDHRIAWKI